MKSSTHTAMLIFAMGCATALIAPGLAQVSKEFSNDKIVLFEHEKGDRGYWKYTLPDPSNSDKAKQTFQPIDKSRVATREAMMKRGVLEEYAEFLAAAPAAHVPHLRERLFRRECREPLL